ncbi:hypothetical protein ACFLVS_06780 [Chloroflexota bacterium]
MGNEVPFRVVSDEKRIWVIKHSTSVDSEKRELLGFLLGKEFCNVCEVELLNKHSLEELKQFAYPHESFSTSNTCLVRLAHSNSLEELPCKTIEEAVATELVYSIWIRRRDTTLDNRVYIKGIPMFFDFHIAFLGEADLADINVFYSQNQDHGRAGLWRVKIWNDFLTQFTGTIDPIQVGTTHFINSMPAFYQQVDKSKTTLKRKLANKIEAIVNQVNFSIEVEEQIIDFLINNLNTLDSDVNKMLKVLRKDS